MVPYQFRPFQVSLGQGTAVSTPPPPAAPAPSDARTPRAIPTRTLVLAAAGLGLGVGGYAAIGGLKAKKGNGSAAKGYLGTMTLVGAVGGILSLGILGYSLLA